MPALPKIKVQILDVSIVNKDDVVQKMYAGKKHFRPHFFGSAFAISQSMP